MKLTEKQKNCPYCHPPYKPFTSTGKEMSIDLENSSPIYVGVSNVLGEGPITETLCGVVNFMWSCQCTKATKLSVL